MDSIVDYQKMLKTVPAHVSQAFQDRPLAAAFATIGGVWMASKLYDISAFTWLHFIRGTSLGRYESRTPEASWALVTGASDGIGRGFAEELCQRGFNVVLHGRNETKLKGVKDAILNQWPERKVKLLVIDAAKLGDASELEAKVAELGDIDLRILINNIGGGPGAIWNPLENQSAARTAAWIDVSSRFPTEITRCLLPRLTRDKSRPGLIMNICSGASEGAVPYISVYSGAKAYNISWSRCLGAEMKAEGHSVEVMAILVGVVANNSNPDLKPSLTSPTSRRFAESCLDKVGCGKGVLWAYWPHALQMGTMLSLPYWLQEKVLTGMAKDGKAKQDGRPKRQ